MELEHSNETAQGLGHQTSSLFELCRQSEAFGLEKFRLQENSKLEEVCGDFQSQNEELQNMLDKLRSRQISDDRSWRGCKEAKEPGHTGGGGGDRGQPRSINATGGDHGLFDTLLYG